MSLALDQYSILVIDDEIDISDILKTVLSRDGFKNVYVANTGHDGIEMFKRVSPDIVLLDIMLPDISGYEIFKKLKSYRDVPILFISAKGEEVDRLLGFAIGADDYVTKPFSAKEVSFRVQARLRSLDNSSTTKEKDEDVIEFGNVRVDTLSGEIFKGEKSLTLTAKELQLIIYLARNSNQIISKEMICREVWGEDFLGYDNTITVHIRKLRKKIEDDPSNPQYIKTVIGLGYKLITKGVSHEG